MFRLSGNFLNLQVLSLRTGGPVATATQMIINPNNLKVEGWYCQDKFSKEILVLLAQDVREIIPQGIAVDDHEALTHPSDLPRLQKIMDIKFELPGKLVVTDQRRRVGKVSDFAVDLDSFMITKLYVSQPLYKTISGGQLSIDRSQVIEVTDKRIKVKDVDIKLSDAIPVTA